MTKYLRKERRLLDANTTIYEVIQHCVVNFIFGFLSSVVIMSLTLGYGWLIFIVYYLYKQTESKILNRNKYTSRLGKYWIFPLPSTTGFYLGWYITNNLI